MSSGVEVRVVAGDLTPGEWVVLVSAFDPRKFAGGGHAVLGGYYIGEREGYHYFVGGFSVNRLDHRIAEQRRIGIPDHQLVRQ